MIVIQLNGESMEVREDTTIADLLIESKVQSRFCAVELNLEIVSKDRYESQRVHAGDQIEVVTLVGGG